MLHVTDSDRASFEVILKAMMTAWNDGDGAGFAARMADNADFVTIRADHLHGREEIAASHRHILETIYAGSRNTITLEATRMLSGEVALVHACCVLDAPTGPLAGQLQARFSAVLLREDGQWRITAFHITLAPLPA